MKKSFFILALGLSVANFSFVQAATPAVIVNKSNGKISVQDISNLRLKVLFDNVAKNTASVEIYNSKGEVFYQELSDTNTPLVLNLTHLDDGHYTLSIVADNDKLTYDFNIESQTTRVALLKN